jgi:hypothetical protein
MLFPEGDGLGRVYTQPDFGKHLLHFHHVLNPYALEHWVLRRVFHLEVS